MDISQLAQQGWMTVKLMEPVQALALRDDLLNELRMYPGVNPEDPFVRGIPRVLGGMIKSGHASMTYTTHRIRELARPKFFEVLQSIPDDIFRSHLDFERPNHVDDLSCNPDAVFVSDGKPVRFPPGATNTEDGFWWHVDASRERSFLQAAVVLDNPDGSERFAVIERSHLHFDLLKAGAGARMQNDWFLLNADEVRELEQVGCSKRLLQLEPGTMVVWFSNTVHTVAPANLRVMHAPRVQTYVCFGVVPKPITERDLHMKVSSVLFGASCRHLPYPCVPEWQMNVISPDEAFGPYRDVIFPTEWLPWVFGANPSEDFTDSRLSVYGITLDDVRMVVSTWESEFDAFRQLFMI
jgi:hypothetical protein